MSSGLDQPFDKSSKWLLTHHGDSILRLAGVTGIASWSAVQAELVQPRKLPDGLLEVHREGVAQAEWYLVEIDSRPDRRVAPLMPKKAMLVYLDKGELPEAVTLVLSPRGGVPTGGRHLLFSPRGRARMEMSWEVVKLWEIPAEELLAANDVGLVPWLPLTKFEGPPEPLVEECRRRIEEQAPPQEKANLLAVTQVLGGLRYNDPRLWDILGGREAMLESPVLQGLLAETKQDSIFVFLKTRFGPVPPAIALKVRQVTDLERLDELTELAAACPTIEAFDAGLDS